MISYVHTVGNRFTMTETTCNSQYIFMCKYICKVLSCPTKSTSEANTNTNKGRCGSFCPCICPSRRGSCHSIKCIPTKFLQKAQMSIPVSKIIRVHQFCRNLDWFGVCKINNHIGFVIFIFTTNAIDTYNFSSRNDTFLQHPFRKYTRSVLTDMKSNHLNDFIFKRIRSF